MENGFLYVQHSVRSRPGSHLPNPNSLRLAGGKSNWDSRSDLTLIVNLVIHAYTLTRIFEQHQPIDLIPRDHVARLNLNALCFFPDDDIIQRIERASVFPLEAVTDASVMAKHVFHRHCLGEHIHTENALAFCGPISLEGP